MTIHRSPRFRAVFAGFLLSLGLLAGTGGGAGAADNAPDTPHQNACTAQQIEGGWEEVDGECAFTDWNNAHCPGSYQAEVPRAGGGVCFVADGCVTAVCNGAPLPPGSGGGSGGNNDPDDLDGDGRPDWSDLEDGWFGISDIGAFIDWCHSGPTNYEFLEFGEGLYVVSCNEGNVHYECAVLDHEVQNCNASSIPETFPAPAPSTYAPTAGGGTVDEVHVTPTTDVGPAPAGEITAEIEASVQRLFAMILALFTA